MTSRRWLVIASASEVASLAVLLLNRATVHVDPITSVMGPIHGFAYLCTIALAAMSPIPRYAKLLSWVPVIGGVLALRASTSGRPAGATRGSVAGAAGSAAPAPRLRVVGPSDRKSDVADASVPALRAVAVSKAFRSGTVVGPLTFTVPRGRITGIVGPNGAGKTTALRMAVGLIAPTNGHVEVEGIPIGTPGVLERVGALIEAPALVPALSGRRNLRAVAALAGWETDDVDTVLSRVDLTKAAEQRVSTYSLGMRQRLALATTLLHAPRLLILDEPANGLDPRGIAELRRFLRDLADSGVTIVVSSHLLGEVEQVCDHLVLIASGTVRYEGPVAEILEGATEVTLEPLDRDRLVDLHQVTERTAGIPPRRIDDRAVAVAGDRSLAARVGRAAHEAGIEVAQIRIDPPTLETVFLRLTDTAEPTDVHLAPSSPGPLATRLNQRVDA